MSKTVKESFVPNQFSILKNYNCKNVLVSCPKTNVNIKKEVKKNPKLYKKTADEEEIHKIVRYVIFDLLSVGHFPDDVRSVGENVSQFDGLPFRGRDGAVLSGGGDGGEPGKSKEVMSSNGDGEELGKSKEVMSRNGDGEE